jgi:predicted HicB family RNase H-like nuclease
MGPAMANTRQVVRNQDAALSIRLYSEELKKFKKAAKRAKKSLADWVRTALHNQADQAD